MGDGAGGQTRTADLLITNQFAHPYNLLKNILNYENKLISATFTDTFTAWIRQEPQGIGETVPARHGYVHSPSDSVPDPEPFLGGGGAEPAFHQEATS